MNDNITSNETKQKATQEENDKKLADMKKVHDTKLEAKYEEIRGLSTEIETMKFEAIQKT